MIESRPMSYMLKALAGIGMAAITSDGATAQGVVLQRNLSLAMAKTIAEATLAECKSKGFNTAAAVVDRAGQVMVILRDEQGTAQMVEMARRKAYTARMYRMTTMEFQKRTAADPTLPPSATSRTSWRSAAACRSRWAPTPSAASAARARVRNMDDACAKAGVAKVAELLK